MGKNKNNIRFIAYNMAYQHLKTTFCFVLFIAISLVNSNCVYAEDTTKIDDKSKQTTKALSQVQQKIADQKKQIALTAKKRKKLEQQLKQDELAIAKAAKAVKQTQQKITKTRQTIAALTKQKQQLIRQKQQQQKLLAQQLRAAYSTGNHDYLKLLLNQEKPSSIERTLTYYQYFNNARISEIKNLAQTVASLEQVSQQQQQELATLTQLKTTQIAQQKTLSNASIQRKSTLKKLSKQLLTNKEKLARLEAAEQNLAIELEKLQQLAQAEVNLTGLAKLKHKLNWPVKGRLLKRFGNRKQGYLKWKGVLIASPVGRDVKAIHNGKVLFSDWLNGYGLVIVIDHGNGYMSLYGHNQALLKNVGDRVETGEPIALVGQSGGQASSGLYFEIRKNGQAMNPKIWCR